MTGKISNNEDSICVALWKELVYWGFNQAAVGLLCDVFDMLEGYERAAAEGREPPPFLKGGLSHRANCREDLMIMLGDSDGDKLRAWRKAYQSDRDVFLEYAADWADVSGDLAHSKIPPEFLKDVDQNDQE